MPKTRAKYIELAEEWAGQAAKDRNGWGWKVSAATAAIAQVYATLALAVDDDGSV